MIAIIAILAAMLLPALQNARERGRAGNCLSNLKQFGMAASMYCDNYDDYFMPAGLYNTSGWTWGYEFYTKKYLPGTNGLWKCPSAAGLLRGSNFSKDFTKSAGLYPANFQYTAYGYNDVTIGRITSKTLKDSGGNYYVSSDAAALLPVKRSRLRKVAGSLLFGETCDNNAAPLEGSHLIGNGGKTKHDRHHGGANVVWNDGHVSYLKKTAIVLKYDYAPQGYQNHYYQWR